MPWARTDGLQINNEITAPLNKSIAFINFRLFCIGANMSLLQQSQTLGHPVKAAKFGLLLGERRLGTKTPTGEARPMIDGFHRPLYHLCWSWRTTQSNAECITDWFFGLNSEAGIIWVLLTASMIRHLSQSQKASMAWRFPAIPAGTLVFPYRRHLKSSSPQVPVQDNEM